MIRTIVVVGVFAFGMASSHADILHLKDGSTVEGKILEKTDSHYVVDMALEKREIPVGDVTKVEEKRFNKRTVLKKEFKKREKEVSKDDVEGLMSLALWANENGLKIDYKKTLRKVIKVDTDHERARKLLGYERFEEEWKTPAQIEEIKERRLEEKMLAEGKVKVDDKWVPKEDAEMMKKGYVKYNDKWVTPTEKINMEAGRTLEDGEWLTEEERLKRQEGLFKIGDKYLPVDEANAVHAAISDPWMFENEFLILASNHGHEFARKVFIGCNFAYRQALETIGAEAAPVEGLKPQIVACAKDDDYRSVGNAAQADFDAIKSSNYSQFCAFDEQRNIYLGAAVYALSDDYAIMMARQATAEVAVRAHDWSEEIPRWIVEGIACMVGRIDHSSLYAWNYQALQNDGGVMKLDQFFEGFAISEQTIVQSGLMMLYLVNPDSTASQELKDAWAAFKTAANAKESTAKPASVLQNAFKKDADNFQKWLDSL